MIRSFVLNKKENNFRLRLDTSLGTGIVKDILRYRHCEHILKDRMCKESRTGEDRCCGSGLDQQEENLLPEVCNLT